MNEKNKFIISADHYALYHPREPKKIIALAERIDTTRWRFCPVEGCEQTFESLETLRSFAMDYDPDRATGERA